MNCEQSNNLFDPYLDGELSSKLETELLSHLVDCPECRQALAILEVAGHVIKTDTVGPQLSDSFSDRLLACIAEPPSESYVRFRSIARWGLVGLGAAAALTFAVGALSGRPSLVAGSREKVAPVDTSSPSESGEVPGSPAGRRAVQRAKWEPVERSVNEQQLDMDDWSRMTVMQLLNALGLESSGAGGNASSDGARESRSAGAAPSDGFLVEEF